MNTTPTKFTGFRCPVELLEKAKKIAEKDHRSLSGWIVKAIAEAMERETRNQMKDAA